MELIDRTDLVDLIYSACRNESAGFDKVYMMDCDFQEGYQYWTMTSTDGIRIMVRKLRVGYMAELQ